MFKKTKQGRRVCSRRSPIVIRLTAAAVVTMFGLQENASAAITAGLGLSAAPIAAISPGVKLPDAVALLDDFYHAGSDSPMIILLQDAHTNPSAQLNIARALEQLTAEHNLPTVYLEGGKGNLSLTDLRSAPAEDRRAVGLRYLKKGLLQGSEYFDLTSNRSLALWGVENRALYERSLRVYRDTARARPQSLTALTKITRVHQMVRDARYSPQLAEWDRLLRRYAAQEIPITEYAVQVIKNLRTVGIDEKNYPYLNTLTKLAKNEAALKAEQAQEGMCKIAASSLEFGQTTDEADRVLLEEFMRMGSSAQSESSADAVCDLLLKAAADMDASPDILEAVRYLKHRLEVRAVSSPKIFDELTEAEGLIGDRYARTAEERRVLEIGRMLEAWKAAIDLKLNAVTYGRLASAPERLTYKGLTGYLNRQINELDRYYEFAVFRDKALEGTLRNAREFYQLAERRDRFFVGLMRRRMREQGETSAVLITGGYHSEHLKRLFKSEGISYVSFIPRVSHETDTDRYEKLLLSQLRAAASRTTRLASSAARTEQPAITMLQLRVPGSGDTEERLAADLGITAAVRPQAVAPNIVAARLVGIPIADEAVKYLGPQAVIEYDLLKGVKVLKDWSTVEEAYALIIHLLVTNPKDVFGGDLLGPPVSSVSTIEIRHAQTRGQTHPHYWALINGQQVTEDVKQRIKALKTSADEDGWGERPGDIIQRFTGQPPQSTVLNTQRKEAARLLVAQEKAGALWQKGERKYIIRITGTNAAAKNIKGAKPTILIYDVEVILPQQEDAAVLVRTDRARKRSEEGWVESLDPDRFNQLRRGAQANLTRTLEQLKKNLSSAPKDSNKVYKESRKEFRARLKHPSLSPELREEYSTDFTQLGRAIQIIATASDNPTAAKSEHIELENLKDEIDRLIHKITQEPSAPSTGARMAAEVTDQDGVFWADSSVRMTVDEARSTFNIQTANAFARLMVNAYKDKLNAAFAKVRLSDNDASDDKIGAIFAAIERFVWSDEYADPESAAEALRVLSRDNLVILQETARAVAAAIDSASKDAEQSRDFTEKILVESFRSGGNIKMYDIKAAAGIVQMYVDSLLFSWPIGSISIDINTLSAKDRSTLVEDVEEIKVGMRRTLRVLRALNGIDMDKTARLATAEQSRKRIGFLQIDLPPENFKVGLYLDIIGEPEITYGETDSGNTKGFMGKVVAALPVAVSDGEIALEMSLVDAELPEWSSEWIGFRREAGSLVIELFGKKLYVNITQKNREAQAGDTTFAENVSREEWQKVQQLVMQAVRSKLPISSGIPVGLVLKLDGDVGRDQLQSDRLKALAEDASKMDKETLILIQGSDQNREDFTRYFNEAKTAESPIVVEEMPLGDDRNWVHIVAQSESSDLAEGALRIVLEDLTSTDPNRVAVPLYGPALQEARFLGRIPLLAARGRGDLAANIAKDEQIIKAFEFHRARLPQESQEDIRITIQNFILYLTGRANDDIKELFVLPVLARLRLQEALRVFALGSRLSRQSA